jgi:serine/threonine-protein kinase ATR
MKSLAKPRKVTIHGSDGQTYAFLGKPKDDLRKDARLMDFNSIINKILNMNSDSRRRQLRTPYVLHATMAWPFITAHHTDIRTYGVVTLNEECGFIQWVPDTIAVRYVLIPLYEARGKKGWVRRCSSNRTPISQYGNRAQRCKPHLTRLRRQTIMRLARYLRRKSCQCETDSLAHGLFLISRLARFPPVFHEWFLETFPEPSTWLAGRLVYTRSAAVMSMIGFILGYEATNRHV